MREKRVTDWLIQWYQTSKEKLKRSTAVLLSVCMVIANMSGAGISLSMASTAKSYAPKLSIDITDETDYKEEENDTYSIRIKDDYEALKASIASASVASESSAQKTDFYREGAAYEADDDTIGEAAIAVPATNVSLFLKGVPEDVEDITEILPQFEENSKAGADVYTFSSMDEDGTEKIGSKDLMKDGELGETYYTLQYNDNYGYWEISYQVEFDTKGNNVLQVRNTEESQFEGFLMKLNGNPTLTSVKNNAKTLGLTNETAVTTTDEEEETVASESQLNSTEDGLVTKILKAAKSFFSFRSTEADPSNELTDVYDISMLSGISVVAEGDPKEIADSDAIIQLQLLKNGYSGTIIYDSTDPEKYPAGSRPEIGRDERLYLKFDVAFGSEEGHRPTQTDRIWTYDLSGMTGVTFADISESDFNDNFNAKAGTYNLKNGVLTFTFSDSWLKTHGSNIKIKFIADFKLNADDFKDEDNVSFKFPGSVTIEFPLSDGTTSLAKQITNTGSRGNLQADYKITLKTNYKIGAETVVTDTLGENMEYVADSFKVDGVSINESSTPKVVIATSNGVSTATITLPDTLSAEEHTITYSAKIKDGVIPTIKNWNNDKIYKFDKVTNNAQWKNGNTELGKDSVEYFPGNLEINKEKDGGVNTTTGEQKWKTTINSFVSLNGYVFTDSIQTDGGKKDQNYTGSAVFTYYDANWQEIPNSKETVVLPAAKTFSHTVNVDCYNIVVEYSTILERPVLTDASTDVTYQYRNYAYIKKNGYGPSDYEDQSWTMKGFINKDAAINKADQEIKWTVTLNANNSQDLSNYVFTDKIDASYQHYIGSATVTNATTGATVGTIDLTGDKVTKDEANKTASFSYMLPDTAGTNKFVITYTTKIDQAPGLGSSITYNNRADLTHPAGVVGPEGGVDKNPTWDKPVSDVKVIDKTVTATNQTTGISSWKTVIKASLFATDGITDITFQDDFNDEYDKKMYIWFLPDSIVVKEGDKNLTAGSDYTITYNREIPEKTGTYQQFNITFDKGTADAPRKYVDDITITYDTQASKTAGTYENYANVGYKLNGTQYDDHDSDQIVVPNTNYLDKAGAEAVWNNELGTYVIPWTIAVNTLSKDELSEGKTTINEALTITDTLPAGLEYMVGSAEYGLYSGGALLGDSKVKINPTGEDTLVFTIPEKTIGKNVLLLTFNTQVVDKTLLTSYGTNFSNHAAAELPDGTSWSDDASVTVKSQILNKTGEYDTKNAILKYKVEVNRDGKNLGSGSKDLVLEDVMSENTQYVISSFEVTDQNGNPVDGCTIAVDDNYKEHDWSNVTTKLTMKVPNSKALTVRYNATIKGTVGDWKYVSNSILLKGYDKAGSSWGQNYQVAEKQVGASGEAGNIAITKFDEYTGVTIPDVSFQLYRVKLKDAAQPATLVAAGKTDLAGTLTFEKEDNTKDTHLVFNELYYLTEESAPDGYIVDKNKKYYVMLESTSTTETDFEEMKALALKYLADKGVPEKELNFTNQLRVANHTAPSDGILKLSAEKRVNDGLPLEVFDFELTPANDFTKTNSFADTRTYHNDLTKGKIAMNDIPLKAAGTYVYTLKETANKTGYVNDTAVYTITAEAALSGTNDYEAKTVTYKKDGVAFTPASGNMRFNNTIAGTITVKKNVFKGDNIDTAADGSFYFRVYQWNVNNSGEYDTKVMNGSADYFTVKANEQIDVSGLALGTQYKVVEAFKNANGNIVDDDGNNAFYTVSYTTGTGDVANVPAAPELTLDVSNNTRTVEINNRPNPSEPAAFASMLYKKTINGSVPGEAEDKKFSFNVSVTGSNGEQIGSAYPLTVKNTNVEGGSDYGFVTIGQMSFTKADTYIIDITENNLTDELKNAGYVKDETQYRIKLTVALNANNELKVTDTQYLYRVGNTGDFENCKNLPKDKDVFDNTRSGQLTITKNLTESGISGKEFFFKIYDEDLKQYQTKNGSEIFTLTYNGANSKLTVDGLPLHRYTVTEVNADGSALTNPAADGYGYIVTDSKNQALTDNKMTVTLATASDATLSKADASFKNEPRGQVSFQKTDASGNPLAGAEFTLYKKDDTSNLFKLVWTKLKALVGAATEKAALEFTVTDKYSDGSTASGINVTISEDMKGIITISNLKAGAYVLKETKAPDGYTLNETAEEFTISANETGTRQGLNIGTIQIKNSKTETVFSKRKADVNGTLVSGAKLEVYSLVSASNAGKVEFTKTDDFYESWTSGTADHKITGLKTNVPYRMEETSAPTGFQYAASIIFMLDDTGNVQLWNGSAWGTPDGKTVVMVDEGVGEISISKQALGDGSNAEVPGAALKIYKATESDADKWVKDETAGEVDSWTSKTTPHSFENITADSYYILHEEGAPNGYAYAEDVVFYVDRNGAAHSVGTDGKPVDAVQNTIVMEDKALAIKISKTDITGEKEIPGATLTLFEAVMSGSKWTTGTEKKQWVSKNTAEELSDLDAKKTYILHETGAPDGYKYTADVIFRVEADGSVVIVDVDNVEQGTSADSVVMKDEATEITFSKQATGSGAELPGASLEIRYTKDTTFNGVTHKAGEVVVASSSDATRAETLSWVSGTTAKTVTGLKVDTEYEMVEQGAPAGYAYQTAIIFKIDGQTGAVQVKQADGNFTNVANSTVVMKDKAFNLSISKTEIAGDKELPGATLAIYGATKIDETKNDKDLSNWEKGALEFTPWVSSTTDRPITELKAGYAYYLVETNAPETYAYAADMIFKIEKDGTILVLDPVKGFETKEDGKVVMKDALTTVSISKQDIADSKELPGAELTIYYGENVMDGETVKHAAGTMAQMASGSDYVPAQWHSTDKAQDIVGLIVGVIYKLVETGAPNGYAYSEDILFKLDKNSKPYLVNAAGEKIQDVESVVMHDDITKVTISKTDLTGDKEIPGATLQLFDKNGNKIDEWTSTTEAHEFKGTLIAGETYTLKETNAPDGYAYAEDVTFTVSKDGTIDAIQMKDDITKVTITKTDLTGDKEIPGATLQLFDKDGNKIDEWISTTEAHEFKGTLIAGETYTLKETNAPDGYSYAEDMTFTVSKDGKVDAIQMKDDVTHVTITKTDITGDKEIPGATLQVIDKDGNVIDEWVSTDKAHEIDGILNADETYTLRETNAPDGYAYSEDITFTVEHGQVVTQVVMKDDVTKVQISKTDLTGDKELPGATLQVIDKDGKVVEQWVSTDKAHSIEYPMIAGETYTLKEIGAPTGYAYASDMKFTVSKDGSVDVVKMKDDTTKVSITKVAFSTKKELPGASLQLTDAAGNVVDKWTSTDKAHLIEGKLVAGATYTLTEITAPAGYRIAESITFTVNMDGTVNAIVMEDHTSGGGGNGGGGGGGGSTTAPAETTSPATETTPAAGETTAPVETSPAETAPGGSTNTPLVPNRTFNSREELPPDIIFDDLVPLGNGYYRDPKTDEILYIPDEGVPLAGLAKTGDKGSTMALILWIMSGCGLAGVVISRRRKENEQ